MRIGYARVSTEDQNLELQKDALKDCETIYEEKASGRTMERPELASCLKALRAGDTLVVWRLDRLGRNLQDLIKTVTDLEKRGVAFESVTEKIETQSATGRLVFHLFSALAEFERNLTVERTKAGLAAARARGRKGGRPEKLTERDIIKARAMLSNPSITKMEVAQQFGVSRPTLDKALRAYP